MLRHAVALFIAAIVLWFLLCLDALAGQFCVIDPPRAASATGTGFYVARPSTSRAASSADTSYRLFDPAGEPFRPIGPNIGHDDNWGRAAAPALTGANSARLLVRFSAHTPAWNAAYVDSYAAQGMVPFIGNWNATCKTDAASLAAIVDTWVAQASTWTTYNGTALMNIANEWGPAMSSSDKAAGWRDGYLAAISRMRAAGYTMPLVIDAGSCGQDAGTILTYGQTLLDADPEHNLLFDVHVYSSWHFPATATWMQDYAKSIAALKATGLPIIIGEFGPPPYTRPDGTVYLTGPSPTMVPSERIIADADAAGWGWMPWSWDDVNSAGCTSSDVGGFSLTKKCGIYTGDDANELTAWGRTVVPMLKASQPRRALLARP